MMDNSLTILGIDPGTSQMGIAIADVDLDAFTITDAIITTIYPEPTIVNDDASPYTYLDDRLRYIRHRFREVLNYYKPTDIAIESPFFNPRSPGAYGPLSEVRQILKSEIRDYSPYVRFKFYSPSEIKVAVNAPSDATKDQVYEAMCKIMEMPSDIADMLPNLNDNEIDALAAIYTHISIIKKEGVRLCLC